MHIVLGRGCSFMVGGGGVHARTFWWKVYCTQCPLTKHPFPINRGNFMILIQLDCASNCVSTLPEIQEIRFREIKYIQEISQNSVMRKIILETVYNSLNKTRKLRSPTSFTRISNSGLIKLLCWRNWGAEGSEWSATVKLWK